MKFLLILISFFSISSAILPKIVKESKDGQFYLIVDAGGQKILNWIKAEQECNARGDHLASIHNNDEMITVGDLCQQSSKDTEVGDNCWIGGFFDANRDLNWMDGTPVDYTNWQEGNPNNYQSVQYCVSLINNNPNYSWDDLACFKAPIGSRGVAKAVCRRHSA